MEPKLTGNGQGQKMPGAADIVFSAPDVHIMSMQPISRKAKAGLVLVFCLAALALFARHYFKSNYVRTHLYSGSGYGGTIGDAKRETLAHLMAYYKDSGAAYSRGNHAAILPLDSALNDTAKLWETDNWTVLLRGWKKDGNNVTFLFQEDTLWCIQRYRNSSFIPDDF
jgi:hypothetical protein